MGPLQRAAAALQLLTNMAGARPRLFLGCTLAVGILLGVLGARGFFDEVGAAWAQAILSAAAIGAAVWLQDRERIIRRQEHASRQIQVLLTTIGDGVDMLRAGNVLMKDSALLGGGARDLADLLRRRATAAEELDPTNYDDPEILDEIFRLSALFRRSAMTMDALGQIPDEAEVKGETHIDEFEAEARLVEREIRRRCGHPEERAERALQSTFVPE